MFQRLRNSYLFILPVLVVLTGCRVSPWSSDNIATPSAATQSECQSADGDLQSVMAEVRELGTQNPALQSQLLAELDKSDPCLWPLVVESFRSRIAYGEQLNQKEMLAAQAVEPHAALARDGSALIGQAANTPNGQAANQTTTSDPSHVTLLPATDSSILPPDWPSANQTHPTGSNAWPTTSETNRPNDGQQSTMPELNYSEQGQTPTSLNDAPSGDWRSTLAQAIGQLDAQLRAEPSSERQGVQYAKLRLLELAAGQPEAALSPLPGMGPSLSRFWTSELATIETMLQPETNELDEASWMKARDHLRNASASLGEALGLEVRNMAFCRAVQSYGSINRFEKYEFDPGQRILLYAEIENFRSEPTPDGYHTSLRSNYQIFDNSGQQVANQESTTTEEYCSNRRRDYFVGCDFRLPETLRPGRYRLKLTVEDLKTAKVGEASLAFVIK